MLGDGRFAQTMRLAEVEQLPFVAMLGKSIPNLPAKHVRALEVGAGSATASRMLTERFRGTFYALDVLPEAIRVAKRAAANGGGPPVHCLVADLRQAPLPSASFDLVFSQGLIEHFADPLPVVAPQVELLKPGGCLVINVPQKYNLYTLYKHFRMRRGKWAPGWETAYSAKELAALGARLDLELDDIDGEGSFSRMVLFRLLRPFPPARSMPALVRLFDRADRLLGKRIRSLLCLNVVATFRKRSVPVPEAAGEGAACRS
jgi:SAM-dependent methyltransferase